MTDTIFFRLLDGVNRPSSLSGAIEELREGREATDAYSAEPESLRQVPGSPFAYWVSEDVRRKFTKLPPFESQGRKVKQGLATADDFRFVRVWWEVTLRHVAQSREKTLQGNRWVPFAKGGDYSPYYADVHLVVNWERDGKELKAWAGSLYNNSHWSRILKNVDYYFHPGLTWSLRTQLGLSFRALPAGGIFGHKGPVAFLNSRQLKPLLAVVNSRAFHALVELQMAFGSYEAGVIKRTPVLELPETDEKLLSDLALSCIEIKRGLDTANETKYSQGIVVGCHHRDSYD
jgi:hypothetical protein